MEFERYDEGVPSWVDLSSPDLAKSREFYGALFGWNCPEGPPEAGGYSVCATWAARASPASAPK